MARIRKRFEEINLELMKELLLKYDLLEKKIVSFIGSISFVNHPVDLLLDAFEQVKRNIPDVRLLIVGGGEDYDTLSNQVRARCLKGTVIFVGFVPPEDIINYYRISSVTTDPVLDNDAARGRLPLKMFESWASEVPFITGDVGDRRYISGEPPAALIVKPGDLTSLAEGIKLILSDLSLAKRLKELGLQRVQNYYWETIVNELDQTLKKTIDCRMKHR